MNTTIQTKWRMIPKKVRDSVIACLEFDAGNSEDAAPFGSEEDIRSRAFRLAAKVLREAAR
jgi:hypothetical protein